MTAVVSSDWGSDDLLSYRPPSASSEAGRRDQTKKRRSTLPPSSVLGDDGEVDGIGLRGETAGHRKEVKGQKLME